MKNNIRDYASQTNKRLIIGALAILFLVGIGLIWWLYGGFAALMGFLCLLGAFVPIGLVALSLNGLEWLLRLLDKERDDN